MKQILIIEDDERIASALSLRFQAHGYDTRIARDAVLGLAQAVGCQPNLVLLDISLRDGDGFELARQLRARPDTRNIPFIFVTASKDPDLRRKAMELNAAGLVEKPYDAGELVDLARYAMGDTQSMSSPPLPAESIPMRASSQMAGKRILIVEDDPKIAQALTIRLKSEGCETSVASDAIAAVSTALRVQPDVVLLDISMPAGDGFVVAERLMKNLASPTRLIFLTASKQPGFRERALKLGAAGYFEKPFDSSELMASIQQALLN